MINYNPENSRFTINLEGTRIVLQNINNFAMRDMEKVINAFSKERFDLVLLSIPPLNNEGNSLLASI